MCWGYLGAPPYTYEWRRNCGPIFNPGNFISNQPSITLSAPYCQPTFWIQLKITASDGAVRTVKRKIYPCDWFNGGGEERSDMSAKLDNIASIFPNPAGDVFRIVLSSRIEQKTSIRITDGFGKVIKDFTVSNNAEVMINTSGIASGTYHVIIFNSARYETHKLFINKQ